MEEKDLIRKKKDKTTKLWKTTLSDGSVIPLIKFEALEALGIVEHCFTTREGGVSKDIFASLNLSFTRGDEEAAVRENYKRLAEALGVSVEDFVFTDQTHTDHVIRVGKAERGMGITKERAYHDVDGLVTDEPGVVLSTFFADCVPLYFVDPVHHAIGMSHSGWRGTVKRMGQRTLEKMKQEFGTDPGEVTAAVGPSICQDCYEVSQDVAEEFQAAFPGHETEILFEKGNGKYQLDLWRANERVLLDAGITKDHLVVTDLCTCCNPDYLFSHRASHGRRGNLGGFLYLK